MLVGLGTQNRGTHIHFDTLPFSFSCISMILSALLLTAGVPDQLSADFDAFLFFLPALGRRLRLADYDHRLDFAASDAFLIFLLMIPGQKSFP